MLADIMNNDPLRLALGGMVAMAAGIGIGRFAYTPILPAMVDSLHLSNGDAGLIASANFAGYLAGALGLIRLRPPTSRLAWLAGALLVSAAAMAGMAMVGAQVPYFLLLRFIGGVASAAVFIFASAIVLDQVAARGRFGLSAVHFAGVGTGIAVSGALIAVLTAMGGDWREMWLASAVAGLVAVGIVAWLVSDQPHDDNRATSSTGCPAFWPFALFITSYGLFGFGYVITATFLVSIVHTSPEVAPLEPYVWVLLGLSAAPSVAFWAWLGARLGTLPSYAAACLLEALGVAASVLWHSTAGIVVAAICFGGTFMGLTALGTLIARAMPGGDPRRKIAAATAAFGLGQIIGPMVAGIAYDRWHSFVLPSFAAVAALCVAGAIAMALHWSDKIRRHRAREEAVVIPSAARNL
jgi:MFS family permease